jgi:hypothetical protein
VDLERGEALADRHQLDDVDVHVRGLAGRPFDRGGDVVGGQRLGSGVDGRGPLAVAAEAHLREFGAPGQARFDTGHPDSGAVQVGAQVQAELVHERLGRAVDVAARVRVGAGDRAEVDHVPAAARDHLRQERTGHVDQARAVGFDHLLPLVEVGLGGRLQSEGQPRVVDQDVDLGEVGREFGREPLDAGAVAHVEGQREQDVGTEFLGQVGEPLGPPRRRDDPVAQRREPAGGSGPEAGARAGDEYSSHGMHPSAPAWRYRAAE